jgi:hypothetical protein
MKHKTFDFKTAYIDLLLNVLTGILFLFLLTTLLIQPKKESQDAGLKKNAELVINITWDHTVDCDIDIWVRDPQGSVVSFQKKESGIMYIERDDLGSHGDFVFDNNKNMIGKVLDNSETWILRGLLQGKFVVNLHAYSCRKDSPITHALGELKNPLQVGDPINLSVEVEVIKLNPDYRTIKRETVTLTKVWEEKTVFSFELDKRGNPQNFNSQEQVNLIKVKEGTGQ